VPESGAVDAEPGVEPDHLQRVVDLVHTEDHDVGGADLRAVGDGLPRLDVLGVPTTDFGRSHTRTGGPVEADDVNLRRATMDATMHSPAMRRFLIASVTCGVVITASTIASAVVLAHMVAGVITDPGTRTVTHWAGPLWILAALWLVRGSTQWLQGRLSQRGATAAIADLTGRVLHAV